MAVRNICNVQRTTRVSVRMRNFESLNGRLAVAVQNHDAFSNSTWLSLLDHSSRRFCYCCSVLSPFQSEYPDCYLVNGSGLDYMHSGGW